MPRIECTITVSVDPEPDNDGDISVSLPDTTVYYVNVDDLDVWGIKLPVTFKIGDIVRPSGGSSRRKVIGVHPDGERIWVETVDGVCHTGFSVDYSKADL